MLKHRIKMLREHGKVGASADRHAAEAAEGEASRRFRVYEDSLTQTIIALPSVQAAMAADPSVRRTMERGTVYFAALVCQVPSSAADAPTPA